MNGAGDLGSHLENMKWNYILHHAQHKPKWNKDLI